MPKRKKKSVVKSKVKSKKSGDYEKLNRIILDLVYRIELNRALMAQLKKRKLLEPNLEVAFLTEIQMSHELLQVSLGVNKSYVLDTAKQIKSHATFEENVNNVLDKMTSGGKKFKLYSTDDVKKEAIASHKKAAAEKKIKTGGNVLISG